MASAVRAESCLDLALMELVAYVARTRETKDAAWADLEHVGVHIGQRLAERWTVDKPRFAETLDMMKWVARELWSTCFGKQVDNLRTNHKGVFVLTDNRFRSLIRLSGEPGHDVRAVAEKYVAVPCGIIRGALEALGLKVAVVAELNQLPAASFTIKISS